MNTSGGKEWYGIGLDTTEFQRDARRVTGEFDKIESEANRTSKSIQQSILRWGAAYLSLTGFNRVIKDIAAVRGEFQQLEIAFETMLGSAERAKVLMDQLVETAAKTPFDLTGVATGAKQLMAYGFEAEKVNETLITLGDVAAGVSSPLNDIVYLYGTLRAQGRVFAMDIRQFAGRGIPIYEELSKVLKVSVDQINELVSAGKVGFKDVEQAFANMTSEGGRFNNLMEKQSASIVGLKSNLGDAIDVAANDLGKKLEPAFESALRTSIELAENYEEVGQTILELVAVYGTYKAALIAIMAINRLNMMVLRQAVLEKKLAASASITLSNAEAIAAARTKLLTVAQVNLTRALKSAAAWAAANPYVLLAAAIAGLAYGVYKLVTAETAAEKAQRRLNEETEKAAEKKDQLISRSESLISAINDETKTVYQQVKAWEELQDAIPDVFRGMSIDDFRKLSKEDAQKLINQSIDKREIESVNREYEEAIERVESIREKIEKLTTQSEAGPGASTGMFYILTKQLKEAEAYASLAKDRMEEINELNKEAEFQSLPKEERLAYYQKELDALRSQRSEIEQMILDSEKVNEVWAGFNLQTIINQGKIDELNEKIGETTKKIESLTGTDETVQNKSYWEKIKKDAEEARDALDISKRNSAEWKKYEREIAEAQAQIEKYATPKGAEDLRTQVNKLFSDLQEADEKDREIIAARILSLQQELLLREQIAENAVKTLRDERVPAKINAVQQKLNQISSPTGLASPDTAVIDWLSAFGDLDRVSTDALKNLRDKLKKYLSEIGSDISKEDFKEVVDAFEAINQSIETREPLNTLSDSIKDYKYQADKVKALKEQLKYYKEQKADLFVIARLEEQILNAENDKSKAAAKTTRAINEIGRQGGELVGAIGEYTEMLGNFGVDIGDQGREILNGVGQMMNGLESIDLTKPFTVVTGAIKTAAGFGNMIASLLGGGDSELSQKTIDTYEDLMSTMDDLISKQKELLDAMAGAEAVAKSDEAIALINKQIEATKKLGQEWLNSGASWKSHSHGYNLRKTLQEYASAFDSIGVDFEELGGRVTGLFDLSPEQLQTIKEEIPEAWARIDDQTRAYLQTIIDSGEELEGMKGQLNEVLTELSFDSAKDSLKDLLMDADTTMADIADNFEDYMKKAIIGVIVDGTLKTRIQQWYDAFADAMRDDLLSDNEREALQAMYDSIYKDAANMRDAAFEAAGIDEEPTTQAGLSGAIRRELTEETGGELAGIWRRSSDDTRQIRDYTKISLSHLAVIETNTANTVIELRNTVEQLQEANIELKNIVSNTKPQQTGRDLGL